MEALEKEPGGCPLVYMRMFSSMQDAIGHKLFLESVSSSTLLATIRTINPKRRDIRPLIEMFNK